MTDNYEFIDAEKDNYPIVKMCHWLGVSRSGFYAWRDRAPSATAQRRGELEGLVRDVFDEHDSRYGYRKIHYVLTQRGVIVSEWLVRDIMNTLGLVCCHPRPYKATTIADNDALTLPDLVGRDFVADRPGQQFVGDITYIRTWEGWLYLATMIDTHTREVVGYHMDSTMHTRLVTTAVDRAVAVGLVSPGAVFHSDRGSQYTSNEFHDCVTGHGMRRSVGRTGVCWDNAMAESFFASLKKELVHRVVFPTRKAAKREIRKYIEVFYNRRRIHAGIDYSTPLQARLAWQEQNQAA